jgi:hypothetical protein
MDPGSAPFELISYRGLLKSLDDFKSGNKEHDFWFDF